MAAGSGVVNDIIGGVGAAGEAGTNGLPCRKTDLLHLTHHQRAAGVVVVELEIIVIGIGKKQFVGGNAQGGAVADDPLEVEAAPAIGRAKKERAIVGADVG